jgi:hypothetical protein
VAASDLDVDEFPLYRCVVRPEARAKGAQRRVEGDGGQLLLVVLRDLELQLRTCSPRRHGSVLGAQPRHCSAQDLAGCVASPPPKTCLSHSSANGLDLADELAKSWRGARGLMDFTEGKVSENWSGEGTAALVRLSQQWRGWVPGSEGANGQL